MKRSHWLIVLVSTLILLSLIWLAYPTVMGLAGEDGLQGTGERAGLAETIDPPASPATLYETNESPPAETASPAGIIGLLRDKARQMSVEKQLEAARRRALDAGSYRYETEIRQTLIPRPLPELIGRGDERVNWHAQGEVQLPDHSTTTIWFDGADPLTLIREGQQTFLKQGDTIKEVQDPTQLVTPSVDFLAYLDAAKNVRQLEPQRAGGMSYTRYAFEIDGPRFAEQVRQQIERELAGELPEGGQIAAPRILQLMTGTGELWVDEVGLPRRQVLDLRFPQATEAYDARVHMITDFRNYGQPQAVSTVVQDEGGAWQVQEIQSTSKLQPLSQFVPAIPSLRIAPSDIALFLVCWLFALGVICYRRYPRQTYAAVTVVVVLVLVGNPLLQSLRWVRFQERQAQAASVETLAEALGLGVVDTTVPATPGQPVSGPAAALNNASSADDPTLDCGDGSPDVDTDQDGLSDFDEGCYGTDYLEVDTDGDTITDTLEIQEIQGVDWDSKYRTSNALKADSNRDGLPDGVEWPAPWGEAPGWDPDGDNIPNTWDDDNDGDGVPDSEDLSPFAVGVYRSSLSVQVVDWNRQGYQYIEFQLQPQDPDHLRYTTTWLDWPDNDTEGNVTSRISDAQDLHLVPFLDVETAAIPGEELRTHYGLVLMQESGHLLIPLFAQGSGGAINSFAGKVAYGPGTRPDIHWNEAQLVWLVQTVNSDGTTGLAHQYVEDFRLTGMQVTKSDSYELGLFGTPDSVLEDEELFNLLIGMSATFLEYKELENQSAGNTVLQEVKQRFDRSDTPLEYKWGVDQRVESSVYTYGHQDQALAESSAQVESYLEAHFARNTELCLDAAGEAFECAGVVVGTEERLRAIPVDKLDGPTIQVPMTGVATFTSRGLRYQMYQRTGSSWKAVGIARTLEIMEKRYAGQWDDILAGYLTDYPYLVAGDLRFVTHLAYQSWVVGRLSLTAVGDYSFVPVDPSGEENDIARELGLLEESSAGLIELYLGLTELHQEINQLRSEWGQPIKELETGGVITYEEFLKIDRKLKSQKTKFKRLAISEGAVAVAVLSSSIAHVACAGAGGCDEKALKITRSVEFLGIGFEAYHLFVKIKDAATHGFKGLKGAWSTMSKGAKALAVAGLVIEIGLIWTTFFVTIGTNDWKWSGFVFDLALGTAIVATIWAIIIFILLLIPYVDIVVGIILVVVALVDLILCLAGVDFSITGGFLSFFYRAEMVTEVESARYVGSSAAGNALDDADLGFVVNNTYRLWDMFSASITGSEQAHNTIARAEWHGTATTDAEPFDLNEKTKVVLSWDRFKFVLNKVGVGFKLNQAQPDVRLKVNTNVHFELRFKHCIFWGLCWYDTDVSDTPGNFEVVLDVLPSSLTGLWEWSEISNPDPDGDDLVADAEAAAGTNPTLWDSDGDGLADSYERDNRSEFGTDPAQADCDGDGLDDGQEVLWGTFPDDDDSDDDGLLDGEEVAGWEVHLPNGLRYWVFSDPLQPDADRDGLTDKMELDNQTSPYATNVAPRLLVAAAPLSVAPGGKPGTYVQPGTPVQIKLGLLNTAGTAVSTTLHICLSNNHLANAQVSQTGATEGTPPPTQSYDCGSGWAGYQWDFGGHILRVGQAFTTTLTATAAGPSGTGQMTYTLPYQDELLNGVVEVVVDDDNPTASLLPPLEGDILTGEHYVIGGYGDDATTWVEEVDLLIDTDTGLGTAYGPPLAIDHTLGAWGYTWELPADGHYTLATLARDPFGHESALTQTVIMVDNTPPTVTPELADGSLVRPEEDQMTVTGQVTDNLAGLSRVQVSVDGGPWWEASLDPGAESYPLAATWRYNWTIGAAAQGSHTVAVRALDRAGHMSDVKRVEFILDGVPPSDDLLTRLYDETPIVAADSDITLTGYANDAGKVPLPPRPAALHGTLDAIADATVWLSPASIHEDDAGVSLAWVGDMDGDGRADLVIGLPASGNGAGKVVILYGRYGDWQLPPDAESLAEEWTSFVGADGAGLGAHVAAAGDVDGDGLDDLLLGDPANKRAFLIYGKPYPLGLVLGPNSPLDGPASGRHTMFTLDGDSPLGDFVAPAGDVNGDGYADLLIGSPNTAYLILGHDMPWFASMEAGAEAAAVIALPASGRAMGVGDVDGDQYDDWVVTDPAGGGLHLMSGSPLFTHRERQALDPASDSLRLAFLPSDGFGATPVAALEDVNGDGLDDFIYSSGNAPALVLGRDSGSWGVSYAFSGFDPAPNSFLAAPGDVDADGKDDLLLGTGDQRAYLILGRADWGAQPEVKATLMGLAGAASAPFAAGADLNCDRSADLLLLPAETGIGQLLSADRPFGAAPRVKQDALAIETTYETPSQAAPGLVMATGIGTMATADTFYVDDDYCADCGNDGHTWGVDAFNNIQEAVNKADNAGDTVVVEPGVYPSFEIGPGRDHLAVHGVDPDAVFVEATEPFTYAAKIDHAAGVTLRNLTVRSDGSGTCTQGIWLAQTGGPGPDRRTVLDHLLSHDCDHALYMDRASAVGVRQTTLAGKVPDQPIAVVSDQPGVPPVGLPSSVNAIAVAGNGDVYVGGWFTDAGDDPNADHIARWDGTQWHPLGSGLNDGVQAIAVAGNGDVYAGGGFTDAGGVPDADHIARWDGTQWHPLGKGLNDGVQAIAVASNGDVYAGGGFTDAGDDPNADHIARWDGTQWHPLDSGLNGFVEAIAVAGNGDVYAGGGFTDAGGVPDADHIARWDGTQWHPLGKGLWGVEIIQAIIVDDRGNVYVGGYFLDVGGGPNYISIAHWDGTQWHPWLPLAARLTFEKTAFVAPDGAGPAWINLDPVTAPLDFQIQLTSDNAWISDNGNWGPDPAAGWGTRLTFSEADFLDPGYGIYRLGAETQLQAGYYTYHPAAYVSPDYCDDCANDGLAWGVTAFSSIQAAIDSGAGRVLLRPGVYQESFHLVNGVQVLGSGAEMTIIQPPPGISSGALVRAEGLALVTLGRLTLDGDGRFDGLRVEDGAQAVIVTRNIIRDTATAIALDGATTQVEIVNNALVGNDNGVVASACAPVDMRNTILSDHSGAALSYQADGCSPPPNHIYRYNAYWHNGHDLVIDDNPAEQPGSGEIRANPRFTSPGPPQHDYRPLDTSPVIDAGNPSDHVPPGTGERIDIGYLEVGQAVFAADDDYCETCLNDGLTWGVNAFDSIQAALDAARAIVINLGAALAGPLTVGVGPGSYNERLTVPSHVRLIGTSADEVTLAGENAGTVITLDGVTDVEIRGLRITGSGPSPYAGIRVTSGARDVLIARNLIAYNGQGIVFEGQATGQVSFNTIVGENMVGVSASGTGTWAEARNNIVAENVSGFVALSDGQILSDYNLLDNLTNYQGVVTGTQDLQADPRLVGHDYHLQPDSPAVDAADPAERAPVGGGQQADMGYDELRAVPLTLLFGRQGVSCAEGNSGVDVVGVALVPVADASLAITETLPAGWLPATLETPGQVGSYWSVAIMPDQNGLHRIYSRATDLLQNQESDPVDWYSGAILVDRTLPVVTWLNPAADITTEDIGLRLRATAADWLDTGAGQQFSLAEVHFEVNGEIYSADWAGDGWSPASGQPRTFEALVPLREGLNLIDAVATDQAGHEARSSLQVTSTTTGDAAVITSNYDGSATNQSALPISGYARFITSSGSGQVLVQVDDTPPVEATLDDPSATFTAWSATVTLAGEGLHVITAVATRTGITTLDQPIAPLQIGNIVNIELDLTPLELLISAPAEGHLVTETVTLMGTVTDDPGSGVQSIQVSLDGGYSWAEAELAGDIWSFTWLASGAESGITYVAQVRATDKAANTTTQTRSFIVDGEPQGLAPLTFNIPVGAHLDSVQTLIANWTAAVDGSGQVTVTAAIDQSPDTVPSQVIAGLSHAASLNANGAWYFHLLARDAAGNGIIYHEGPWQVGLNDASVSCDARQKSISLDGHLDVTAREWLTGTERLDDDERPDRIQSLYVSWDADFLYLGWEGAQWDMDGTLWAYMDIAPGGSNVSLEDGQTLPFDADVAVEVEGTSEGTLWRNGSPETLEFVAGGNQTEIRVPWNLVSVSQVHLLAYALDDDGQVWSVFPTTNPLAGPWSQAYSWNDPCSITDPSSGQPQGTSVPMTLSSPQAPQAAWGPGNSLEYVVDLTNREVRTVTGLQLVFNASAGLAYPSCGGSDTCLLDVPELAPGASHRVNVTGQLASSLGDLTTVTSNAALKLNGTVLAEANLSHRVDGQPPSVQVNLPPGNAIGRGLQIVSGTADDGDGSGVMEITVDPANSVNGASFWTAEVDFPDIPDGQVAPFSLAVQAIDARDNRSEISQVTFSVDAIRPEVLSFTVPLTLSGYYATLPGTARDPEPAGSLVTQVEVQLNDPDSLWQPANGPFVPDEDGTQAWGFIWALPLEDGVTHTLRARAIDVAGNLSSPSPWQETFVDNIAPLITVTTALTELLSLDHNPVLSGKVSDGSGVSTLRVWVEPPHGAPYQEPAELIGDTWRYVLLPHARGVHTLTVEAEDLLGNISQAGPFALMSHLVYLEIDTSGHGQLVYEDWPAYLRGITFTTTTEPLTSTATIIWGDGAVSGPTEVYTTVSAVHTYADPGVYTVTVSVDAPFGLTASDILTMTVLHGFMRRCAYADSRQPGLTLQSEASLDCPGVPGGYPGQQVPSGASGYGRIHLKDSSTITGPLFSEAGEVVLDREVRLLSDRLALPDGTTVKLDGDLTAEEDVVVGDRSLVAGSITGRATVKLERDSLVQGDVTAAETVNRHRTATVSGTITELADIPPLPALTFVEVDLAAGGQDITVEPGESRTLEPGSYQTLMVKKSGTVQLSTGHYYFEQLKTEQDGQLTFNFDGGGVVVDVVDNLQFGPNVQMSIVSARGDAAGILFQVAGDVIDLKKGGIYLGTFLGPDASIRLEQDALLTGALYGHKVDVMHRAQLIGLPARDLLASRFVNPAISYVPPTRTSYSIVTVASPVASFSTSPLSGAVPLTVTFTDESTGDPTSWAWEFGDGGSSTGQHPSHTYVETGSFTVTLTVSNTTGSDTMVDPTCINVIVPPEDQRLIYLPLIFKDSPSIFTAAPPVARFSASPISGTVPLTATFTDKSTGDPTSWSWDFGDGGNSTGQHLSHTYTQPGDYTVTLTVSNDYGPDTMVDAACVNVTAQAGDQRLIYLPLMLKNSP
jgi:PKD repeat protein/nitrous oxidase accessory protein NosD